MNRSDWQELIDATNRTAANVARLEVTLNAVLEATAKLQLEIAAYVRQLKATSDQVAEAQRRRRWF